MSSYCRITGKSRGLPKPNYFPLLPPISPADAKRFCRITGKSYGLPSHHYIPVLVGFLRKEPSPSSKTKRETEDETKHTICNNYRYVTPTLTSIASSLDAILQSKSLLDNEKKYIYPVAERRCSIVLPGKLEEAVRDGDVKDVLLSKEEDMLLLKLGRGETINLDMKDIKLDGMDLWQGKGPNADIVEKIKKRKHVTSESNQWRRKIFEDKEKEFETEESKTSKRIKVKLNKVSEEERTRNWKNVAQSVEQNDTYLQDMLDCVKYAEEAETAEKLLLAEKGKILIDNLPPVRSINSYNVNLSNSSPGIVQQPSIIVTDNLANLSTACVVAPFSPLSAIVTQDIQIALKSLNADKQRIQSIRENCVKSIRIDIPRLPIVEDISHIVSNLQQLRMKDYLNAEINDVGIKLLVGSQEKLITGQFVNTQEGRVFIPGNVIDTNRGSIFVPGLVMNVLGDARILPGQIVNSSEAGEIFVAGQNVLTRQGEMFVQGQVMKTCEGMKFIVGQTVMSLEGKLMFVPGQMMHCSEDDTTGIHFIPGITRMFSQGPEFIPGQYMIDSNGNYTFVPGKSVMSDDGKWEFVPGKIVNLNDGQHLFVPGRFVGLEEKFIPGVYTTDSKTGINNIFVPGLNVTGTNGLVDFVPGINVMLGNEEKFVEGMIVQTEQGLQFSPGHVNQEGKINKIEFVPAEKASDCLFHEIRMNLATCDSPLFSSDNECKEIFGQMIQSDQGVEFFPGNTDGLPAGKLIPGRLVKGNHPRFIPGKVINGKFVAGQVVFTEKGEQFIPGQVIETNEGTKFVPGQVVQTKSGEKFVPGQTLETGDGLKFVPGQIIETKVGPTFIPGQIIDTEDEGSRFVPGQVVETVEGPCFVPGRVIETGNRILFIPGQVVETVDGLKFVAPDLENGTEDGFYEFTVQAFKVSQEELNALECVSMPDGCFHSSNDSMTIDSTTLQQLEEAGMTIGRQAPIDMTFVHVQTLPLNELACSLADKFNLDAVHSIKLSNILCNIQQLKEEHVLSVIVKQLCDKEIVGKVIDHAMNSYYENEEKFLQDLCSELEYVMKEYSKDSLTIIDNLNHFLSQSINEHRERTEKCNKLQTIINQVDYKEDGIVIENLCDLLKKQDTSVCCAFKHICEENPKILRTVVNKITQTLQNCQQETNNNNNNNNNNNEECIEETLRNSIICAVRETSEMAVQKILRDTSGQEFKSLLMDAIGLARALGLTDVVSILSNVSKDAKSVQILAQDKIVWNVLKRLTVMRQLASKRPNLYRALHELHSDPYSARNDPRLKQLVRESAALMVIQEETIVLNSSIDVPSSLLYSDNSLAVEDFMARSKHAGRILLILKQGMQAVIPREASKSVLTGQVPYTVLDEKGITHFNPLHVFNALKLPQFSLYRFTNYSCGSSSIIDDEEITAATSSVDQVCSDFCSNCSISSNKEQEGVDEEFVVIRDYTAQGDQDEDEEFYLDKDEKVKVLKTDDEDPTLLMVQVTDEPSRYGLVPMDYLKKVAHSRTNTPDSALHAQRTRKQEAKFQREVTISELIETEEEFSRDIQKVVEQYLAPLEEETRPIPRNVLDNKETIFNNLGQIAAFHNSVMIAGVKYFLKEPKTIGKTLLRLERDFDKHALYCKYEPEGQALLEENSEIREYFDNLSTQLSDDKILSDHLKLPIQRINDYQLLLKELIKFSKILNEDTTDIERALELMLWIPTKCNDLKFVTNIEGYHGNIHKLGRLIRHNWFLVKDKEATKARERYCFLFKARILICKVRRISEDRCVFVLKDIIKLPEIDIKNISDKRSFQIHHRDAGYGNFPFTFKAHEDQVKADWLNEIQEHSDEPLALVEHATDDLKVQLQSDEDLFEPLKGIELDISPDIEEGLDPIEHRLAHKPLKHVPEPKRPPLEIPRVRKPIFTCIDDPEPEPEPEPEIDMYSSLKVEESYTYVETSYVEETQVEEESAEEEPEELVEMPVIRKARYIPGVSRPLFHSTIRGSSNQRARTDCGDISFNWSSYKSTRISSSNEHEHVSSYNNDNNSSYENTRSSTRQYVQSSCGSSVSAGENASFECEIEGASGVMWLKDNIPLTDRLADRISMTHEEGSNIYRLDINNVSETDSGTYTARAENNQGPSLCTAQLIVEKVSDEEIQARAKATSPVFSVQLKDAQLLEGTHARFMVKVNGNPKPKVTFYRGEEEITENDERVQIIKDSDGHVGFYELVIPDVKPQDAAEYKCVASNKYSDETCSCIVTVTNEKDVFAGLEEQIKPGETPKFTWLKNGKPFRPEERFKVVYKDEEDSLALVFQNVKAEDAGLYTCVASTAHGKIFCSAELTVQGTVKEVEKLPYPPKIGKAGKQVVDVNLKGTAVLEVNVDADPEANIKWYKGSEEISSTGRFKMLYEEETKAASLVIKNVALEDMGKYTIVASNDLGLDSQNITLNIKAAPILKKQLEDCIGVTGKDIKLNVQIEASPKPIVQWYKDGKVLKQSKRVKYLTDEASDSFTLVIQEAVMDDAGLYSVVASNEFSQISDACHITMQSPPQFIGQLTKEVETFEGDYVSFSVMVEGDPLPQVKWLFKGKELQNDGEHVKISSDGAVFTMLLSQVDREDAGTYVCEINNIYGKNECEGHLTVKCLPRFREELEDIKAKEGDMDVQFVVNMNCFPKGTVKWYRDETEITNSSRGYKLQEEGDEYTLVIREATPKMSATYKCVAENEVGLKDTSATFTVQTLPKFKKGLSDIQVKEGETLKLTVQCNGVPEPEIKWYKDGEEIYSDSRIKITRDAKRIENYNLTITLIESSDGGEYEVRATNEMGTAVTKSLITVLASTTHNKRASKGDVSVSIGHEDTYSCKENTLIEDTLSNAVLDEESKVHTDWEKQDTIDEDDHHLTCSKIDQADVDENHTKPNNKLLHSIHHNNHNHNHYIKQQSSIKDIQGKSNIILPPDMTQDNMSKKDYNNKIYEKDGLSVHDISNEEYPSSPTIYNNNKPSSFGLVEEPPENVHYIKINISRGVSIVSVSEDDETEKRTPSRANTYDFNENDELISDDNDDNHNLNNNNNNNNYCQGIPQQQQQHINIKTFTNDDKNMAQSKVDSLDNIRHKIKVEKENYDNKTASENLDNQGCRAILTDDSNDNNDNNDSNKTHEIPFLHESTNLNLNGNANESNCPTTAFQNNNTDNFTSEEKIPLHLSDVVTQHKHNIKNVDNQQLLNGTAKAEDDGKDDKYTLGSIEKDKNDEKSRKLLSRSTSKVEEDDEKPRKLPSRSSSIVEENDEKPRKVPSRSSSKVEEDDEKPRKVPSRSSSKVEEDDEKPRKVPSRSSSKVEEDDEKPRKLPNRSSSIVEENDEKPRKVPSRSSSKFEEDDEKPRKLPSRSSSIVEENDEKPRKVPSRSSSIVEENDEKPRKVPSRSSSKVEEDDEKPRKLPSRSGSIVEESDQKLRKLPSRSSSIVEENNEKSRKLLSRSTSKVEEDDEKLRKLPSRSSSIVEENNEKPRKVPSRSSSIVEESDQKLRKLPSRSSSIVDENDEKSRKLSSRSSSIVEESDQKLRKLPSRSSSIVEENNEKPRKVPSRSSSIVEEGDEKPRKVPSRCSSIVEENDEKPRKVASRSSSKVEENDEAVNDLLKPINRQRSILGEIIEKSNKANDNIDKEIINKNNNNNNLHGILSEEDNGNEMKKDGIDGMTMKQEYPKIIEGLDNDLNTYETLAVSCQVKATGVPKPQATWYKDEEELTDGKRIRITDDGDVYNLEILDLRASDGGCYKIKLENSIGDTCKSANIHVSNVENLRGPKIQCPLENVTWEKGQKVVMRAVFIADPVPDAQWTVNGKNVNADFKVNVKELDLGLKECTYLMNIPTCELSDTGTYKIRVSNKFETSECSAHLTIVMKPEIEFLKDVVVTPTTSCKFQTTVTASPHAKVTWLLNGNVIECDDKKYITREEKIDDYKTNYTFEITDCGISDQGEYTLNAVNDVGQNKNSANLTLHTEPPSFVKLLEDRTVQDQDLLQMKVRVNGLPKPNVTWFKDGKEIVSNDHIKIETSDEGQLSSLLSIESFTQEDVALYKIVAENIVGKKETCAKLTMAQIEPSFAQPLKRITDVDETTPLELSIKVIGSPIPSVQWYKDGEEINENKEGVKIIKEADGRSRLLIQNVCADDCGAYKVVASNAIGKGIANTAVVVNQLPKCPIFVKQLEPKLTVVENEPIVLQAQLEAYPEAKIKWLKDGHQLHPCPSLDFVCGNNGTYGLTVEKPSLEDAGLYCIVASNKIGEGSSSAKVTVLPSDKPPAFLTPLHPTKVVEGFPAKLPIKVLGYPLPKLTWKFNGEPLKIDGDNIKLIQNGEDGSQCLLIEKVGKDNEGIYELVGENDLGNANTQAQLTVTPMANKELQEEKPLFLNGLRDCTVDESRELVLSGSFLGNPIPQVIWYKDGCLLQPDNRTHFTCDGYKVGLEISDVTMADGGLYSCVLNNAHGQHSSDCHVAVRKLYQAPVFSQRFKHLQQLKGHDAKFHARVAGVPFPSVVWHRNGQIITNSKKYEIKRDGDVCCLTIKDCETNDDAVYACIASNRDGTATCEAQLQIVDKIDTSQKREPPTFMKKIGDCELYSGMTAKFTACATGLPEPQYEWYLDTNKLYPSDRIIMEREISGLVRLKILEANPDVDAGVYRLRAFNKYGEVYCEAKLTFESGLEAREKRPVGEQYKDFDRYRATGAPLPLANKPIISLMTDRRLTLSWKPSIPIGPREPVTYLIEMAEQPDGQWFTARAGVRSCVCDIHNLIPFCDYKFRVRVENNYGISDPSPHVVTYREKLQLDAPTFRTHLPDGATFHPDTSFYFPKDFDIERPPHDNYAQAPRFLRQEYDVQYGVKSHNVNLFWFVYGYPKPKMSYLFNDVPIEMGGRYDCSYTRNGQATLFINRMMERDVGIYEAVAVNEHGMARQRVKLQIAEYPEFIKRPEETFVEIRKSCKLEAKVIGVPYPQIKWYKDWQPLAASSRITVEQIEPDICVLRLNEAIQKDEGLISISARNIAGSISTSVALHVLESDLHYNSVINKKAPVKTRAKPFDQLYDLGDEIGRGTQSVVHHVVERSTGKNYAGKVMHGTGQLRQFMQTELDIMNQLNHRNIIRPHDALITQNSFTIIQELAAGGELLENLTGKSYTTESEISNYIRQLLLALQYMHDFNIAHLGLTPGDLLISHVGGDHLKVTDFGKSRKINSRKLDTLLYGMPEYVAPEVVNEEGVNLSADMWSVGVITHLLLTGISLFKGKDDADTLERIKNGQFNINGDISNQGRDFISKLLMMNANSRMDVKAALQHDWILQNAYKSSLTQANDNDKDKDKDKERMINTDNLRNYYNTYKDWYGNASCQTWYRLRPLSSAYSNASRMIYPIGLSYTPPSSPEPIEHDTTSWRDRIPSRAPIDVDIGLVKSESHYQSGPDTYLLQLRDVDFPVRLREYMKAAHSHSDWKAPVIRERRKFMDVMDEEIDDERKARITGYGNADIYTLRRLKQEISTRPTAHVEAEAILECRIDGQAPFFREKPQILPVELGKPADLVCLAVGIPKPVVQWFKNDLVVVESHRVKLITDRDGRSILRLQPVSDFDLGIYKIVARNKFGQTVTRTRLVMASDPSTPDAPEIVDVSDTEMLLKWKQPKDDGNSPILCYALHMREEYNDDWTTIADNINHEFWLVRDLRPHVNYQFRLAAMNSIGWSYEGPPTQMMKTKLPGVAKISITNSMRNMQAISESGHEIIGEEQLEKPDYSLEHKPFVWQQEPSQDKYKFVSEIFRGEFSIIVKGIKSDDGKVICAKLIDMKKVEREQQVEDELKILHSLRHERIAYLIEAFKLQYSSVAVVILERLQGADILTYLSTKQSYTEQTVATIISQVLDGLQYMHWRGYCHLNLQPSNMVMSSIRSVQVKLVDFAQAMRINKLGTVIRPNNVPLEYTAPEILCEEPAFPNSDIWSVGVVTYILLSAISPFSGKSDIETRQNITFVRYRFEHLYKQLSQEATRFLMSIFKRSPSKRPSTEECHEHRWLLPTEYMIKKREKISFDSSKLKIFSKEYHTKLEEKATTCKELLSVIAGGAIHRSTSIVDELSAAVIS